MPSPFWKKNDSETRNSNIKGQFPVNFFLIVVLSSVCLFFGFLKFVNFFSIKFYYFYSAKIVFLSVFGGIFDWIVFVVGFLLILLEIFILSIWQKSLPLWISWLSFVGLSVLLLSFFNVAYVALVGFPLVLALVGLSAYFGYGYEVKRSTSYFLVLLGVVCIVLFFNFTSLLTWIWNVLEYSFPFVDVSHWRYALFDLQLFNVLYNWVPWLFLGLFFCWAWIPLVKCIFSRLGDLRDFSRRIPYFGGFGNMRFRGRTLILALLALVIIGVFVSCYPLFNRSSSSLVGSDSAVYYGWIEDMAQNGPWIALQTDRPLSNLIMFVVQNSFGLSSESIVRLMPVLCCVGLGLAVFWFVRIGLHNDTIALTSGFFTIFSFQTTVGIYAYSVSNLLGLIFAFLFLGFMLKSSQRITLNGGHSSWICILVAGLFGVALLFTHPWTWDVVTVILLAY